MIFFSEKENCLQGISKRLHCGQIFTINIATMNLLIILLTVIIVILPSAW